MTRQKLLISRTPTSVWLLVNFASWRPIGIVSPLQRQTFALFTRGLTQLRSYLSTSLTMLHNPRTVSAQAHFLACVIPGKMKRQMQVQQLLTNLRQYKPHWTGIAENISSPMRTMESIPLSNRSSKKPNGKETDMQTGILEACGRRHGHHFLKKMP